MGKTSKELKQIFNRVVWDKPNNSYTAYGQKWVMEYGRMPFPHTSHKLGRNDPCWCGSGKKYKHCHGKNL